MLCFERNIYLFILFFLILSSPPNLHADWSWSFPFNSSEQPASSVAVSRSKTDVSKPAEPQAAKSINSSAPAPPAKSQQPAAPLPSLPETTVNVTRPQPITPVAPREVAPFAPTLKLAATVINEDTVWRGAIQVEGMVTVAAGATLTISPGSVVRFGSNSGILVLGRIEAKGSADIPVIFSSLFLEPHPSDWYGIVLTGTAKKNIFENVIIHGAETAIYVRFSSLEAKSIRLDNSLTAIRLLDSIGSFKDVTISDCSSGLAALKSEVDLESVALENGKLGISAVSSAITAAKLKISAFTQAAFWADKSQLKLADSLFSTNLTGARISASEGSILNSRFIANIETGLTLSGSYLRFSANLVSGNRIGLQLEDNLPAVWGNSIHGNSNYNLLYLGDEKFYLGGNWLGKANADSVDKSLFSRRPGAVLILPLLAADPLSASENVVKRP